MLKKVFKSILCLGILSLTLQTMTSCSPKPQKPTSQFDGPANGEEIAVMKTNKGIIKMRFFPQDAPKAVENFITHSKNGYYNNLIFHRVMENFMIQGGDPEGTGMGGKSIWGGTFGYEFTPKLHHIRGAVAMAHSQVPDSNGSQFYIVQNSDINKFDESGGLKAYVEELKNNPDGKLYDVNAGMPYFVNDELLKDPKISAQVKPFNDPNGVQYTVKDAYPPEFLDSYLKTGGTITLDYVHTVFGQVFEGMDIVDNIAATEVGEGDKPVEDIVIESITIEKYKK